MSGVLRVGDDHAEAEVLRLADSVNHGVTGRGGVGHCGGELYSDVGDSVVAAAVAQVGVGDGGNVDRLNVESVLRQHPVYPSIDVAVGDLAFDLLRGSVPCIPHLLGDGNRASGHGGDVDGARHGVSVTDGRNISDEGGSVGRWHEAVEGEGVGVDSPQQGSVGSRAAFRQNVVGEDRHECSVTVASVVRELADCVGWSVQRVEGHGGFFRFWRWMGTEWKFSIMVCAGQNRTGQPLRVGKCECGYAVE